jgi:putative (di)nucleoside polyphosphate hydrolase
MLKFWHKHAAGYVIAYPEDMYAHESPPPVCIGQKQKWFLLSLIGSVDNIQLNKCHPPEFDGWQWVSYWYPLNQVVSFKREVYRKALQELAPRSPTLHDTY